MVQSTFVIFSPFFNSSLDKFLASVICQNRSVSPLHSFSAQRRYSRLLFDLELVILLPYFDSCLFFFLPSSFVLFPSGFFRIYRGESPDSRVVDNPLINIFVTTTTATTATTTITTITITNNKQQQQVGMPDQDLDGQIEFTTSVHHLYLGKTSSAFSVIDCAQVTAIFRSHTQANGLGRVRKNPQGAGLVCSLPVIESDVSTSQKSRLSFIFELLQDFSLLVPHADISVSCSDITRCSLQW